MNILKAIFGSRNDRVIRRMRKTVEQINALEPGIVALNDAALQAKTEEFKTRLAKGEKLDALPVSYTHLDVYKRQGSMRLRD